MQQDGNAQEAAPAQVPDKKQEVRHCLYTEVNERGMPDIEWTSGLRG